MSAQRKPSRLVVFLAWVFFTYLFAITAAVIVQSYMVQHFAFDTLSAPLLHLGMLGAALFIAGVSSPLIWLIPTDRRLVLVALGATFGFGAVSLMVFLLVLFFGGFEANMAWFSLGLAVVVPSVISGAIAGYYKPLQDLRKKASAWPIQPTNSE
jgi:hypothetical protein